MFTRNGYGPEPARGGGGGEMKHGDWRCPQCNDHQFARNEKCRRCGAPKPSGAGSDDAFAGSASFGAAMMNGDWRCPKCNDHQFARNDKCRRCGAPRPAGAGSGEDADEGGAGFGAGQALGDGRALGGSASGPSASTASRQAMVSMLFGALAEDGAASLKSPQLRRFAGLLGFDGGEEEWAAEYSEMCGACGWNPSTGADSRAFAKFVNDQDSGGHCADDMLRKMLQDLKASGGASASSAARSRSPRRPGGGLLQT